MLSGSRPLSVGLIRVVTSDNLDFLESHGRYIREMMPAWEVLSRCIPDQPDGVFDDESEARAIPKVVALARRLEAEGVQAVIVSCAADPGVEEARHSLRIPVIGAGSAAACAAMAISERIGVLNLIEHTPEVIRRLLDDRLVAEEKPESVRTTLDLSSDSAREAEKAAIHRLVARGANCILLACTGYTTLRFAREIRREMSIPVIDPVEASAAAVAMALGGFGASGV